MSKHILALMVLFSATPAWAAFPVGWARSCVLTVQKAKVSADQINFPVLVSYNATSANETNLPDEMVQTGSGNEAQADGGDIRFTSDAAGSLPLNFEIVTFTQDAVLSNVRVEIWVKLPHIYTGVDTPFYVWYKASSAQTVPAVTDPQWGSQGVWGNRYVGVWHLGDGTTLSVNDSTLNANHGTAYGGLAATLDGIGGAGSFNGTDGAMRIATSSSLNFNNCSYFTMQLWAKKIANTAGNVMGLFAKSGRYGIDYYWGGEQLRAGIRNSIEGQKSFNANPLGSLLVWNQAVFVYEPELADGMKLYVNGALGNTATNIGYHDFGTTADYGVGNNYTIGGSPVFFYGYIDELRISSVARSATWIATEYNNQSAPDTFLVRGTAGAASHPPTFSGGASLTGVGSMTY